jgi:hypothetical protein
MELEDKIKLLLSYEGTKKNWKNVHNSPQWVLANEVAVIVMREPLNKKPNCGCLNDLFYMLKNISKSKIKLKQLQMENEFELKPGILLFINGTHYSNANITDKVSLEILKNFPVKINAFVKYPKNWEELCEVKSAPKKAGKKTEAPKTEEKESASNIEFTEKELEEMSAEDLRELCTKLAETRGVNKLNHKAGKAKMIAYLIENKVNG